MTIQNKYFLTRIYTCAFGLLFILSFCDARAQDGQTTLAGVRIYGLVVHPYTIGVNDLGGLKSQTGRPFAVTNDKGETKKRVAAFKGILLADILRKAGVNMEQHKDRGKYYIVVTADDGYRVLFSYNELMYGTTAAYLIPAPQREKPDPDGPFMMACPGDKVTGPRFIKRVTGIEVRKI